MCIRDSTRAAPRPTAGRSCKETLRRRAAAGSRFAPLRALTAQNIPPHRRLLLMERKRARAVQFNNSTPIDGNEPLVVGRIADALCSGRPTVLRGLWMPAMDTGVARFRSGRVYTPVRLQSREARGRHERRREERRRG